MSKEETASNAKKYLLFSHKKNVPFEDEDKKEETLQKVYEEIEPELEHALRSENLIILSGAGSSKTKDGKGGKSMEDLWKEVEKIKIKKESGKEENEGSDDKATIEGNSDFEEVKKLVSDNPNKEKYIKNKNLEELLSRLQIQLKAVKNNDYKEKYEDALRCIEQIIIKECTIAFSDEFPHERFLRKLLKARKKTNPRLKIFTLNYDRLFEDAGEKMGAIINDGFSFSQGGKFRSTNFDLDIVYREQTRIHNEENFYDKVFHLYKIHGSIDWEEEDKNQEIFKSKSPKSPLLIYPNSSKYESSYQMPFFEMISRFQSSLRKENTALFIIGYRFGDNHINRILREALRTNMNLSVFVVSPSPTKSLDEKNPFKTELFSFAKENSGLFLISDTFHGFTHNLPNIDFPEQEQERKFKHSK